MGERGGVEEEKIKFLNDVMEIFYEFKHLVDLNFFHQISEKSYYEYVKMKKIPDVQPNWI